MPKVSFRSTRVRGVDYVFCKTEKAEGEYCTGCAAAFDFGICNKLGNACLLESGIWKKVPNEAGPKDV